MCSQPPASRLAQLSVRARNTRPAPQRPPRHLLQQWEAVVRRHRPATDTRDPRQVAVNATVERALAKVFDVAWHSVLAGGAGMWGMGQ